MSDPVLPQARFNAERGSHGPYFEAGTFMLASSDIVTALNTWTEICLGCELFHLFSFVNGGLLHALSIRSREEKQTG